MTGRQCIHLLRIIFFALVVILTVCRRPDDVAIKSGLLTYVIIINVNDNVRFCLFQNRLVDYITSQLCT